MSPIKNNSSKTGGKRTLKRKPEFEPKREFTDIHLPPRGGGLGFWYGRRVGTGPARRRLLVRDPGPVLT